MGLYNISTSAGLYEEHIAGNRGIEEDRDITGNRYLKDIDKEPLEFDVSFYFDQSFDHEKLRETTRWLLQDTYKPLVFSNHPNRILFAVPVGSYQLVHNGLKQGYLNLTFRCNAPHAYTAFVSDTRNLSDNPDGGTDLQFSNNGDMDTQPIIQIHKVGNGNISFTNLSDGGKKMSIHNLLDDEKITIDCQNKEITTNTGFNRYDDFDFNWLNLIYGSNTINVEGTCHLKYIIQSKIY